MSIAGGVAATPNLGWIVSRTFAIIGRRFAGIGVLTLLLVCAPDLVIALLPASLNSGLNIASSVLSAFYFGSVALIVYYELAGEAPIGAQAAFSAAAGRFGVLFGANILSGLAVLGGLIALILPGLFLMTAWMPLTAVVVAEQFGVTASLGRAWRLTQGHRWLLGGLLALYVAGAVLLFSLLALVVGLTQGAAGLQLVASTLVGVFISSIVYGIGAVGSAVVYVTLRRAKDGIASEVASVFA
ncbi:MAG TPA: hypothetical protein VN805_18260 [Caulobacteraceae bacterium]|nr:hypothetical protein [Caulobacteraceae bacterium]